MTSLRAAGGTWAIREEGYPQLPAELQGDANVAFFSNVHQLANEHTNFICNPFTCLEMVTQN